jgi:hypothetical protein
MHPSKCKCSQPIKCERVYEFCDKWNVNYRAVKTTCANCLKLISWRQIKKEEYNAIKSDSRAYQARGA